MAATKPLPTAQKVCAEINELVTYLVEVGLADDQNLAYQAPADGRNIAVTFPNTASFAALLKDRPYADAYEEQRAARAFNVRMLDGAIIQISYEFTQSGDLVRYRLAFLPSPNLLEYQNNAEIYAEELLYADVVDKRVVTVPVRFDFDARTGVAESVNHPMSHLTLGQYSNCRIPAQAPLTPTLFIEFVLSSFYNTALASVSASMPRHNHRFGPCITVEESQIIHVGVPG